jgi:hypothetical protein
METCERCQELGFSMELKDGVCHPCFFMSAENSMDPGIVPSHLPELSQVEEMVIARAHVQMLVKQVRRHQSVHWPLRYVHAKHRTGRRCAP